MGRIAGGGGLVLPSVWSWSSYLVCNDRHGTKKSPPRGL